MPTVAIPTSIDPTGTKEVWPQLAAFVAARRPGDIVEAPDDATYLCDKPLVFPHSGVSWFWNGAKFKQSKIRPYGTSRTDCVISNGNQVCTGIPLPPEVNWGYVSGPGIIAGTHCQFVPNSRTVMKLDRPATNGQGLPVTFTSKLDRERCGFRITGEDFEHHDFAWYGPVADPVFTPFLLEAQHGLDLAGARNGLISGGDIYNMYGDVAYISAGNGRITSGVDLVSGSGINCARSGIVPVKCSDVRVSEYDFDQVGRTVCNMEPPDSSGWVERFAMTNCTIGSHGLTLMSSGGNVGAHIGRVEFSRNRMTKRPMILWLSVGSKDHYRGPYIIDSNVTDVGVGSHGGTYPTAALVCVQVSKGATITNNRGIKLQVRFPMMAVVRHRNNSGPVVAHGNEFVGGIEVGAWIAA